MGSPYEYLIRKWVILLSLEVVGPLSQYPAKAGKGDSSSHAIESFGPALLLRLKYSNRLRFTRLPISSKGGKIHSFFNNAMEICRGDIATSTSDRVQMSVTLREGKGLFTRQALGPLRHRRNLHEYVKNNSIDTSSADSSAVTLSNTSRLCN